ncbi:glycosyltransferase [Phocaeicola sp.]
MKILLIGEYYNVHWTLAYSLRNLGHQVDILSNGNLWHNASDYLSSMNNPTRWGIVKYTFNLLKVLPQLRGYDVVQLINPFFFELKAELLLYVFQYLKKNNKKIFLGGFESDYYSISTCMDNTTFRYSEFYANGIYRDTIDNRMSIINWMHGYKGKLNRIIANECNGILTGSYESYVSYASRFAEKTIFIPYPIQVMAQPECPPPNVEKIKFYISMIHHREESKGKDKLYSALYTMHYKRPDECEIKATTSTLYDEYDHLMDGCDVILDQLYSYSPSMCALHAMSKGIVVVGGGEERYYKLLGEEKLRPIINVRPENNDIYEKLEYLLDNKNKVSQLSADSIAYIKKYHDPIEVAKQCLEFWRQNNFKY